jgi:hypothetical protein
MATVPQKVMRNTAFNTPEPPVLAAMPPNTARQIKAKPYSAYSMVGRGQKSVTKKGINPPKVKDAPDAKAACIAAAKTKFGKN